jgi:hypothetical protein
MEDGGNGAAILNPPSSLQKVVESAGNAPAWACLQGRCIACLPRPRAPAANSQWPKHHAVTVRILPWRLAIGHWLFTEGVARRPGAAPGGWVLETRLRKLARGVSFSNQKGPGAIACSRPVPFQQRTNTSWRSIRSQPAVSRRLFRCLWAHLLRSPWTVKSSADIRARSLLTGRPNPPVENLGSPAPSFVFCQVTSSRCRVALVHSSMPFVVLGFTSVVAWAK